MAGDTGEDPKTKAQNPPASTTTKPTPLEADKPKDDAKSDADYKKDQKLAGDSERESDAAALEAIQKSNISRKTEAFDDRLGRADEKLDRLQLHTINFADSVGKKMAGDPSYDATKESWGLPASEEKLLRDIPYMKTGLTAEKALYWISTGRDDQVGKGEKAIADLVKDNPFLQSDPKFREGILNSLEQMAEKRKAAGLPPWEIRLKLEDFLKENPPKYPNEKRDPLDLLKEGSQQYRTMEWRYADHAFDKAEDRARCYHQENEGDRLQKFLDGLKKDINIANKFVAGQNVDDLLAKRSESFDSEKTAVEKSEASKQIQRDILINRAFAQIAGGDQEQFEKGKRGLADVIKRNPEVQLDEGFRLNAFNAFKGHYQKLGTTDGAKQPDQKNGDATSKDGAVDEKQKNQLDVAKTYGKVEPQSDKELDKYLVDTLTNIGLTAFVVGTALHSGRRLVNRYRAAAEARRNAGSTGDDSKETEGQPKEKSGDDKTAKEKPPEEKPPAEKPLATAEKPVKTGAENKGPVDIVFLHFNDLHSSGMFNGDVATMTEVMQQRARQAQKEGKYVLAIQGGDEFSGNTVASYTAKGLVENQVVEKMKEVTGLDFTQIIGNHAVDGIKKIGHLVDIAKKTNGTFAVSNLEFSGAPDAIGEGKNFEPFRRAKAIGPNGDTIEIGIIGLTTVELTQEAQDVRLKYEGLVGRDAKEIADVSRGLDEALAKNPTNPQKELPAYDKEAHNDPEGKNDPFSRFREDAKQKMTVDEFKQRAIEFRNVVQRGPSALGEAKFTYTDAYVHAATDTVAVMKTAGIDRIVIASHLGLSVDQEVAKRVPDVALVMGAHSHHAVEEPHAVRNVQSGRDVAVVQAGAKGEFLGETHVKFPGSEYPARDYEVKGGLHHIRKIRESKQGEEPSPVYKDMQAYIDNLDKDGIPAEGKILKWIRDLEKSPAFGADNPLNPAKATGTYSDANLRKGESCLGNLAADCMRSALNAFQLAEAVKNGTKPPPELNGFLKHMGDVRNRIAEGMDINGLTLSDVFCNGVNARELVVTTMTPQMLKDILEFGIHDFPKPDKLGAHDYSGNLLIPSGVRVEYDTTKQGGEYDPADEGKDAGKPKHQGDRIQKISVFNPDTGKYDVVWNAAEMTKAQLAADTRQLRIGTLAHPVEKWAKNGVFADPERYPEFAKAKAEAIKVLERDGGTANAKAVHELAGFKLMHCDDQVQRDAKGKWSSKLDISQPEVLGKYLNGKIPTPSDIVIGKGADGRPDIRPEKIGIIDYRFHDVNGKPPALPEIPTAGTVPLTEFSLKLATSDLKIIIPEVNEPRIDRPDIDKVSDRPPEPFIYMDADKLKNPVNESKKTAEINQRFNEALQPLRDMIRSGGKVDEDAAKEYCDKAREILHPIVNETARALGLPPVPKESIKFGDLGITGHGAFNRMNADVYLNVFEKSPVTVIDHELQHKQRTLDMIAASQADPAGFRKALMESCLNDAGKGGKIITDSGVELRPKISDPEALKEFKDLVRRQIEFDLAEKGFFPYDKLSLEEPPISDKLAAEFHGDRNEVIFAAMNEAENFATVEKQNVLSADKFDQASKDYVKNKAAQYKDAGVPLHENPAVIKTLQTIATDTLGYFAKHHQALAGEYNFSMDEIGSRKLQAARELKRLRREMIEDGDTGKLSEHPQGKLLLERLDLATQQQMMIKSYRNGDIVEARAHAMRVFDSMCKDHMSNLSNAAYMLERGLIPKERFMASPFFSSEIEQERTEQKKAAADVMAEAVRSNKITGSNLSPPVVLEGGAKEYKLKSPTTIERGTETEAKIVSIIELPNGQLRAKYIDAESKNEVVDEFYGQELLKEVGKRIDVSKLSTEDKVKLVSDYLTQINMHEMLGDSNKQAVQLAGAEKVSSRSEIQNPEMRDLVPADATRIPLVDMAKFKDFSNSFDAWHDATLKREEMQKMRDSVRKAQIDMPTQHVKDQLRKEGEKLDKQLREKDEEIKRLRKIVDDKAANLSEKDSLSFERQFALESLIKQKDIHDKLGNAESTGRAMTLMNEQEAVVRKQGLQLEALLGPKPPIIDPSLNTADNPNAHPNYRLQDIERKRATAEGPLEGHGGLKDQLATLKEKGTLGQLWNRRKIDRLEKQIAAAETEVARLDKLADSIREGVMANLKPGESLTIGRAGEVPLSSSNFRSKHAQLKLRQDGSYELTDGTNGKPSNHGMGQYGEPLKDYGTFVKRTAGDGKVTFEAVRADRPTIVKPGDEIFIGEKPTEGKSSRYSTMKFTVPEAVTLPKPGAETVVRPAERPVPKPTPELTQREPMIQLLPKINQSLSDAIKAIQHMPADNRLSPEKAAETLTERVKQILQFEGEIPRGELDNIEVKFTDGEKSSLKHDSGKTTIELPKTWLADASKAPNMVADIACGFLDGRINNQKASGGKATLTPDEVASVKGFMRDSVETAAREKAGAATTSGTAAEVAGLNTGKVPELPAELPKIAVGSEGLTFGEQKFTRDEILKGLAEKDGKDLERIKREEGEDSQKYKDKLAEMKESKAFVERLMDPSHPGHAKALEVARERMPDIARALTSGEEGRPGEVPRGSGRARAVVILTLVQLAIHAGRANAHEKSAAPAAEEQVPPPAKKVDPVAKPAATVIDAKPQAETKPAEVKPVQANPVDAKTDRVKPIDARPQGDVKPAADAALERPTRPLDLTSAPELKLSENEKALFDQTINQVVPVLNKIIEAQNEQAKLAQKPELASKDSPYNLEQIQAELRAGKFGPETARAWKTACDFLQQGVLDHTRILDARGLDFPTGCPLDVPFDKSGRHIGDQLFRAKLDKGQIDFKIDRSAADGKPPQGTDIVRMVNSLSWINNSQIALREADIRMNASTVEFMIGKTKSINGDMSGWLPEKGLSGYELEKWTYGAGAWMDSVSKAEAAAKTIAFLNYSTTHRFDPGLEGMIQKLPSIAQLIDGVDEGVARVFSDEGLRDGVFPGKVVRDEATGKIISLEFDLPKTPERTDENIAKMKRLELWLTKYGDKVNQVTKELTEAMAGEGRLVMVLNDEAPADKYPDKLPNGEPHPKAGLPLQYPPGHPKAGQDIGDFNHMRYGVDVQEKDGLIYVKPFQQALHARFYAYNRWNLGGDTSIAGFNIGAMQKVGDPIYARGDEAKPYRPDEYVAISDNGRMGIIQAKYLKAWADGQMNAEQLGKVAIFALDVAMVVSGTAELRAGAFALQSGELAGRFAAKEMMKGAWHLGIGLTGFGKQAIENFGGETGKEFNKWRHYAIMTELTFTTMMPGTAAKVGAAIFRTPIGQAGAMEKYMAASSLVGKTSEAAKGITNFDRFLNVAHKVMDGTHIPYSPVQAGLFPIADYYFLYDMASTMGPGLADVLGGKGNGDLMKVAEQKGAIFQPGKQHFPEYTAEKLKESSARTLNGYGKELGSESAKAMLKETSELLGLAPDSKERQQALIKFSKIFRDEQAPREDRMAAAIGLMSLRTGDGANAEIGHRDLGQIDVIKTTTNGRQKRTSTLSTENFDDLSSGQNRHRELAEKYKDDKSIRVKETWKVDTITASQAIEFLRSQAGSGNPSTSRLVAADFLSRTTQASRIREQVLEGSKSPDAKILSQDQKKFTQMVSYDYHDLGGVCLDILRDSSSSRELKLSALASAGNPRLGNVHEFLKFQQEPNIAGMKGDERAKELASLYGRDSKAIEKTLTKIVADPKEDADVKAAAAAILYANNSERMSINGIPVGTDNEVMIGSNCYVKVNGSGVMEHHAAVKMGADGSVTIRSIAPGANTWLLKADGTKVAVGDKPVPVGPTDKIMLGDESKGVGLIFGSERSDVMNALTAKSLTDGRTPGALNDWVSSMLKNKISLNPQDFPRAERNEVRMSRLQAALVLEKTSGNAWFESAEQKTAAINNAIVDAIHPANPTALKLALSQLTKERIDSLPKDQIDLLRERSLYVLSGKANDQDAALRGDVLAKLPDLFKIGDEKQKKAALDTVQRLLDPTMSDAVNHYPLGHPELRAQAVKALSAMDRDQALKTLDDVLRKDQSAQVRVTALRELERLGAPLLQSTVIDLLSKETDAAVLKALKTTEFFQRRPDPTSEGYRFQLDEARRKIVTSSAKSLVGMYEYISNKAATTLPAFGKRPASPRMWVGNLWVPGEEKGRPAQDFTGLHEFTALAINKQKEFDKKIPFDEKTAKALTYIVSSNGRPFEEGYADREIAVLFAAQGLKGMCKDLGPAGANKIAWAVESCLLRQNMMLPLARLELVRGLEFLKPGTKESSISGERAAVIAASALERELKRIPARDDKQFERSKELQLELLKVMAQFPDVKSLPVLEAISDDATHPMAEVRQKAKELYETISQQTGTIRATTRADVKLSEKELAENLGYVLGDPKADSDAVCREILATNNGKPIQSADDPRRVLLHMAAAEPTEKIQMTAAHMLLASAIPEDRQRAMTILASLSVAGTTPGAVKEATEMVREIKANAQQKYSNADVEALNSAIKLKEAEKLAPRPVPSDAVPALPVRKEERTLSMQEAYERAKTDLTRNWETGIQRFRDKSVAWINRDWFDGKPEEKTWLQKQGLDKIDGQELAGQMRRASRERFEGGFLKSVEYYLHSDTYVESERKKAGDAVAESVWKPFQQIIDNAKTGSKDHRDFLAFVILSQGKPFMEEHREEAMRKAADAIFEICKGKKQGAGELDPILKTALCEQTGLPADVKQTLLNSFLWTVQPYGAVSKEDGAVTLAMTLENAFENQPGFLEPGYDESIKMQSQILDQLKTWQYMGIMPVLEALSNEHPSYKIKDQARSLLFEFKHKAADMNVTDLLKQKDAPTSQDDRRVKAFIRSLNDDNDKRTFESILERRSSNPKDISPEQATMLRAALLQKEWNTTIRANGTESAESSLRQYDLIQKIGKNMNDEVRSLLTKISLEHSNSVARSYAARELAAEDLAGYEKSLAGTPAEIRSPIVSSSDPRISPIQIASHSDRLGVGQIAALYALVAPENTGVDVQTRKLAFGKLVEEVNSPDEKKREAATKVLQMTATGDKALMAMESMSLCLFTQGRSIKEGKDMTRAAETLAGVAADIANKNTEAGTDSGVILAFEQARQFLPADNPSLKRLEDAVVKQLEKGILPKSMTSELGYKLFESKNERVQIAGAAAILMSPNAEGAEKTRASNRLGALAIKGSDESSKQVLDMIKNLDANAQTTVIDRMRGEAIVANTNPEKVKAWKQVEAAMEIAGIDRFSQKFTGASYMRSVAEKGEDSEETKLLQERFGDTQTAFTKDPTARFASEDSVMQALVEVRAAQEKYGEDSLEAARARMKVGSSIAFLDPPVDADRKKVMYEQLDKAFKTYSDKFGEQSPEAVNALYWRGMAEMKDGKPGDAIKTFEKTRAFYEKTGSEQHLNWVDANLVIARMRSGDKDGANKTIESLVERSRAGKKGSSSFEKQLEYAATGIADAVPRSGNRNYKEAEPLLREILDRKLAHNGEESSQTAYAKYELGRNLHFQNKHSEALPFVESARKVFDVYSAGELNLRADVEGTLGFILFKLDRGKEASEAFERSDVLNKQFQKQLDDYRRAIRGN